MTSPPTGPTPADFDAWNIRKQQIHATRKPPTFKQGEIWWCDLGVNIGNEQNGDTVSRNGRPPSFRRPVLVVKKLNDQSCVALPLTTQPQRGAWYFQLEVDGRDNWVMLTQIRMISARRLTKKVVDLPGPVFNQIRQACGIALGL